MFGCHHVLASCAFSVLLISLVICGVCALLTKFAHHLRRFGFRAGVNNASLAKYILYFCNAIRAARSAKRSSQDKKEQS